MRTFFYTVVFSALSTFAAAEKPAVENILLIVSDDLKADVLPIYGDKICQTPHIDALAKSGMVFERTYCQGTVCGPSRTSFMRSRYLDKNGPTLGEHFIANDFHSARVGKIFHMRVPGDIIAGTNGLDIEACWTERFNMPGREAHTPGDYALLNKNIFTTELEGRQSTRMPHRMFVSVSYEGDGSDQPDFKAAEKTVELLRQRKKAGQPFFLATGFVRPHYPSVAPEQYFKPYPHEKITVPHVPDGDLDDLPDAAITKSRSELNGIDQFPENQQRMWSAYYATVQFLDEQLGKILAELDRSGLRETTAIIFTSDHGYHLGEHTFWQKANLHERVINVPLIVSVPGMKPGRSDSLTELVDIFPTACELTGVKIPDSVEGKSLVPILKNPDAEIRDMAHSFTRNGEALRSADFAYMRFKDGAEVLYDMTADPNQYTNLVGKSEHAETLKTFRKRLKKKLAQ